MKKVLYTIDDVNSVKIIQIGQHFVDRDVSLRKFCEEFCDFSYWTLREKFLTVLPLVNKDVAYMVKSKLENKRAKKIVEDLIAQERVTKAINLLIDQNMTIQEIALELNSTEMTIYRDLTVRIKQMPGINLEIQKEIFSRLKEHSLNNLIPKGR